VEELMRKQREEAERKRREAEKASTKKKGETRNR